MGKAHEHYFYPGKPCFFVASGQGCTIHEDRPPLCQMFECGWLSDGSVPESLWPHKSGVIIIIADDDAELIPIHGQSVSTDVATTFESWRRSRFAGDV